MEKGIHIFSVSIVIIPTRLLCKMQANSSGAELLSAMSKFMKRTNFVIAGQIELLLLNSSVVPSFLVRKGKTIAVVYELTKRTHEKLFAAWAQ